MELEEAILRELQDYLKFYKYHGWIPSMEREINVNKSIEAIESVLKTLENSIPKKKIEYKIKELKIGVNNCDRYNNYSEYDIELQEIKLLQELLEDK